MYTVIRTDLMSGTDVRTDLFSVKVFDGGDQPIEVENGTIVKLGDLIEGEREVYKAVLASASDDLKDCAVIATTEVFYDERKHNLDEFVNPADSIARAYALADRCIFSVTKEGFVGGTVPAKKATVSLGANGKIASSGTGLGTCIDVESVGRYTYYVIKVKRPDSAGE